MSAGIPKLPSEGQTIGEYALGKELGRGSMGVVFEAWHAELRRKVALKIMLPRALALEGVVERFMRGAQLASALSHPNAVIIYGVGLYQPAADIQGLPYMVMEHLEGEDLFAFISRHQRVSVDDTLDIIQQSLEVIADAHKRGIIHRDLKPENLFLTRDREGRRLVKVLDFGLAKAVTEGWGQLAQRLTATGMTCGTPEYMAPEQAVGEEKVGPALDVYALGCILYHMLAGDPPFLGKGPLAIALRHVQDPPPPLPLELQHHFIAPIIQRCLAKLPRARYRDAAELLRAIRDAQRGEDPELRADWPGQALLTAPFRPERGAEPTDTEITPLAPETLQMMPALAELREGWDGDPNDDPLASPELLTLLLPLAQNADAFSDDLNDPDSLPLGAVKIDLEAPSREIDYSQLRGAQTLVTGDKGVPPAPRRVHVAERTEPIPIQKKAPPAPALPAAQRQAQGFAWIMVGIALIIALGVLTLTAMFFFQEAPPQETTPATVELQLNSTPAGAHVLYQGEDLGVTPLTLQREARKEIFTFLFRKEGFQDEEAKIHMDRDGYIQISLKPLPTSWE